MTGEPVRALFSFNDYGRVDIDAFVRSCPMKPQLFADSGAFVAYERGVQLDIDVYAEWLHRWGHLFAAYANLDAIKDPARSYQNQSYLEAKGLRPMPVFHAGESFDWLRRYLDDGHDYIGLGGMVGHDAGVLRWCVQCFLAGKPYGAVFHGFGQTKLTMLRALPWYSVDSTSWMSGHTWGSPALWDDRLGKFVAVHIGDWNDVYAHARLIRSHGYDPRLFADRARYHYQNACGLGGIAWRRCEAWMRKRHGLVQRKGDAPATGGLSLYLVDAAPANVRSAAEALAYRA